MIGLDSSTNWLSARYLGVPFWTIVSDFRSAPLTRPTGKPGELDQLVVGEMLELFSLVIV